ncbi:MAG: hypothetical protein ACHQSE_04195 [Gemmatimonadales bacterium]
MKHLAAPSNGIRPQKIRALTGSGDAGERGQRAIHAVLGKPQLRKSKVSSRQRGIEADRVTKRPHLARRVSRAAGRRRREHAQLRDIRKALQSPRERRAIFARNELEILQIQNGIVRMLPDRPRDQ